MNKYSSAYTCKASIITPSKFSVILHFSTIMARWLRRRSAQVFSLNFLFVKHFSQRKIIFVHCLFQLFQRELWLIANCHSLFFPDIFFFFKKKKNTWISKIRKTTWVGFLMRQQVKTYQISKAKNVQESREPVKFKITRLIFDV